MTLTHKRWAYWCIPGCAEVVLSRPRLLYVGLGCGQALEMELCGVVPGGAGLAGCTFG